MKGMEWLAIVPRVKDLEGRTHTHHVINAGYGFIVYWGRGLGLQAAVGKFSHECLVDSPFHSYKQVFTPDDSPFRSCKQSFTLGLNISLLLASFHSWTHHFNFAPVSEFSLLMGSPFSCVGNIGCSRATACWLRRGNGLSSVADAELLKLMRVSLLVYSVAIRCQLLLSVLSKSMSHRQQ